MNLKLHPPLGNRNRKYLHQDLKYLMDNSIMFHHNVHAHLSNEYKPHKRFCFITGVPVPFDTVLSVTYHDISHVCRSVTENLGGTIMTQVQPIRELQTRNYD